MTYNSGTENHCDIFHLVLHGAIHGRLDSIGVLEIVMIKFYFCKNLEKCERNIMQHGLGKTKF